MGNTATGAGMKFLVVDATGFRRREDVYGGIRLNEWTHVAVVTPRAIRRAGVHPVERAGVISEQHGVGCEARSARRPLALHQPRRGPV